MSDLSKSEQKFQEALSKKGLASATNSFYIVKKVFGRMRESTHAGLVSDF
jgi:hypothetical protein